MKFLVVTKDNELGTREIEEVRLRGEPGEPGKPGRSIKGDKGDSVKGERGVGIRKIDVIDGVMHVKLDNGNEFSANVRGPKGDAIKGDKGRGVSDVRVAADGYLQIELDDGSRKNAGYVRGPKGDKGDTVKGAKGDKGDSIKGDKGDSVVGPSGRGIEKLDFVGSALIFKFTDGEEKRFELPKIKLPAEPVTKATTPTGKTGSDMVVPPTTQAKPGQVLSIISRDGSTVRYGWRSSGGGFPSTEINRRLKALEDAEASVHGADVAFTLQGVTTASEVLGVGVSKALTFPANFLGSVARARVGATAPTAFDIQVDGVSVGTVTFTGTAGAFVSGVVNSPADAVISLVGPASPDATLADISITLAGVRT